MNRIKYWLLCILLNDICGRTEDCYYCSFCEKGKTAYDCTQGNVYEQARKAWGLDYENS